MVRAPDDRTADRVAIVLTQKMPTMPELPRSSITRDQGKEMPAHATFIVATGTPSTPATRSPWQQGSNRNTNGLLRQYLPQAPTCPSTPEAGLQAGVSSTA